MTLPPNWTWGPGAGRPRTRPTIKANSCDVPLAVTPAAPKAMCPGSSGQDLVVGGVERPEHLRPQKP